jgi:hypothetical protein
LTFIGSSTTTSSVVEQAVVDSRTTAQAVAATEVITDFSVSMDSLQIVMIENIPHGISCRKPGQDVLSSFQCDDPSFKKKLFSNLVTVPEGEYRRFVLDVNRDFAGSQWFDPDLLARVLHATPQNGCWQVTPVPPRPQ